MSAAARILLICDDRRGHANTVLDHIEAFRRFSRHQVRTFNTKAMSRSLALDLNEFDAVVIHYSVVLSDAHYVAPHFRDKLRRFAGLKVQFIQDDYRWVDQATAASRDVGINVLFTIAPEPAAGQLYDERLPGVRRVQTLTGYVPDNLIGRPLKPLDERKVDVGYRARDLPFWYGTLSREKAWIGKRFLELAPAYGLRCDIGLSEHDRIYGNRWIEFVSSSRATLGCESGASIADFDGGAERAVRAYLRSHPGASYEEVHDAVLREYEGNVVVHVISPRVFEAASLGTALVMFPGEYSGAVKAGEHYIALEKDFSNMDEVVAQLRDDRIISAMTEAPRWQMARAERTVRVPGLRVRLFRGAHRAWSRVSRSDPSMRFAVEYESQIEKGLLVIRTLIVDSDLRPLLRLGRRAGAPLDRLLREILELSLLRKAATGSLQSDQRFTLRTEFDPDRKSVCFVSVPGGSLALTHDGQTGPPRDAIRTRELSVIEWDHRALGGMIHLDHPRMEVGIGFDGLESFTVLAGIGLLDPSALERALRPALEPVPGGVG